MRHLPALIFCALWPLVVSAGPLDATMQPVGKPQAGSAACSDCPADEAADAQHLARNARERSAPEYPGTRRTDDDERDPDFAPGMDTRADVQAPAGGVMLPSVLP